MYNSIVLSRFLLHFFLQIIGKKERNNEKKYLMKKPTAHITGYDIILTMNVICQNVLKNCLKPW